MAEVITEKIKRIVLPWCWPSALLALGFVLAWLPLLLSERMAPIVILLCLGLAQPMLLLGWSALRGTRDLLRPIFPPVLDALHVTSLWGLAFVLLAVAVAWPLQSLRESAALMPALLLSVSAGFLLLGLWRLWPAFAQAARQGQPLPALLLAATRAPKDMDLRGLVISVLIFTVLALGLALAWPGVFDHARRWQWLLAYPFLSLLVHAVIHRSGQQLSAVTQALPSRTFDTDSGDFGQDDDELVQIPVDQRLYAAARSGQIEAALKALAEGGSARALPTQNEHGNDQRTLPMLAALHSDLRLLRALISFGADLNRANGGLTPLLVATDDSWSGRPEAVMMLLANGADARATDNDGNTPLHHAARSSDPAVAALLLDASAHIDAINHEGFSPLAVACLTGNWRLARFLIEHGARPEPAQGQPALLAAVSGEDDPVGVQLLLRHKAHVDARGNQQRSALLQACAVGNADLVDVLLDAGADRNAQDSHGITPLLEAARHAHTEVIARLAQAKPDVRAVDAQQANALILACLAGAPPELLRQLIEIGVDVEQHDDQGRRAIDIAIETGRWQQVAVLDPDYSLPIDVVEGLNEEGFAKTPRELLLEALHNRNIDVADALLSVGSGQSAEALSAMLLEFAAEDDLIAFDWLVRHGALAELPIDDSQCVLFHLLDRGGRAHTALLRLLERGVMVGGRAGLSRYLAACLSGKFTMRRHEQLALALLERGADPFGARDHADAPLLIAIRLGWQRLIEALLALGVDPNVRDGRDQAAIQVAAALGQEPALRALVRCGALPQARAPDGQTALGVALAAGRGDLCRWLEWRGWQLPGRALRPSDLPSAAIAGDNDAVLRLLDLGLPIDALDHQGCSALLRAAGGGHEQIVCNLLDRGADRHISARTGATPLSAAISMRHIGVVDRLLQAGSNPNQSLPGGVTPMMLAAALGLPEIAGRLLAHGAEVNALDEQAMNALHCAALHVFTARERQRVLALLDLLLLADIAFDKANANGHTPLLLMLGARAEAGAACDEDVLLAALERLLNEGVSLDDQDHRGLTALHIAAMHGLPRIVQRLLREGANRQLRDGLGRSAHDLALLRGYVDIASEFEPARSSPSLARFLRDPR